MSKRGFSGDEGGQSTFEPASATFILDGSAVSSIGIPGGNWLLRADFARQGGDLYITGADGQKILIKGYFADATPPSLTTDTGAILKGALVEKLAGPIAPGQYAQAATETAAVTEPIGRVVTSEGEVFVTRADGTRETLVAGDPVFLGDIVETGDVGALGIEFADESTFSLGDAGRMVLDEFIYDPAAQEGAFGISLVEGAFSFVSGQIAKTDPDGMTLDTPVATIGIRGTTVAGEVGGEGNDNPITLLQDPDGTIGEVVISNAAGTVVLNTFGATVVVTSFNAPPPPPVTLTQEQIDQQYGDVIANLPTPPGEGEEGEEQTQLDPEILEQLAELNQDIADAVNVGIGLQAQYQSQLAAIETQIASILGRGNDDDLIIVEEIIADIPEPISIDITRVLNVVTSASSASATASAAESSASTTSSSLANTIAVQATASGVGLSSSEASDLANVITAPLKALGAAAAVASSASSISKMALALANEIGSDAEVLAAGSQAEADAIIQTKYGSIIAALESSVGIDATGAPLSDAELGTTDSLLTAASKVSIIVTAAVEAASDILTTALQAARDNPGSAATSARNAAASGYSAAINNRLPKDSNGDPTVPYAALQTISGDVATKVGNVSTAVSAAPATLPSAVTNTVSLVVSAASAADASADAAFAVIDSGDADTMLTQATTALTQSKEAESFRQQADAEVDITTFTNVDPSVTIALNQAIAADSQAETSASTAARTIGSATEAIEAANDFIDGTAQADVTTKQTAFDAAAALASDERAEADTAAGEVVSARAVLFGQLVDAAIAQATANVRADSLGTIEGLLATAQTDVATAQQGVSDAESALTTAQGLAAADPANQVLAADVVLKQQLLANAQAELSFQNDVQALFQGARDTAETLFETAEADSINKANLADGATLDVKGLVTAKAGSTAGEITLTGNLADVAFDVSLSTVDGGTADLTAASTTTTASAAAAKQVETLALGGAVEQGDVIRAQINAAQIDRVTLEGAIESGGDSYSVTVNAAQVDTVTFVGAVDIGDVYSVTVGANTVSFTAERGEADLGSVAEELVKAINADATVGAIVTAALDAGDGVLTLTAVNAAATFTATASSTDGGESATTTTARQSATVSVDVTGTESGIADVRDALVAAINADGAFGGLVTVAAGSGVGQLTLTSDTAGRPLATTAVAANNGATDDNAASVITTSVNFTGGVVEYTVDADDASLADIAAGLTTAINNNPVVGGLEGAASAELAESLVATQAEADAGAEARAEAILDLAVSQAQTAAAAAKAAAEQAAEFAQTALSHAQDGTADKVLANAAEQQALAAVADAQNQTQAAADALADATTAAALDYASQGPEAAAARTAKLNLATEAKQAADTWSAAAQASGETATAASDLADLINPHAVDSAQARREHLQDALNGESTANTDASNQQSDLDAADAAADAAAFNQAKDAFAATTTANSAANDAVQAMLDANGLVTASAGAADNAVLLTSNLPNLTFAATSSAAVGPTATPAVLTESGASTAQVTRIALGGTATPGDTFTVTVSAAQVDTVKVFGTPEAGDLYSVTVNGATVNYIATGAESGVAGIRDGLISAINASGVAGTVTAAEGPSTDELTITADASGAAFTSSASVTNITGGNNDSLIAARTTVLNVASQTLTYTVTALTHETSATLC